MFFVWYNKRTFWVLLVGMLLGSLVTYFFQTTIMPNNYSNRRLYELHNVQNTLKDTQHEVTTNDDDTTIDIDSILPHNLTSHEQAHKGEDDLAQFLYKNIKIACFFLTQPENHESKAYGVINTWGKRCNILYAVSTKPLNASIPTVIYEGQESRDILWGKTKLGFKHAYVNYFDDADWFIKADDDTYLILENIRYLLLNKSPATPVYYGCKYKVIVPQGYMSGGAGYILSKEALRRFIEVSLPNDQLCKQDDTGAEDAEMGFCLTRVGVEPGDSRDAELLPRFFPFPPSGHLIKPSWNDPEFWYWKNIWYMHEQGLECCSDSVIGFHYIDKNLMWTLEYFVYHVHPFGIDPLLTGSKFKNKIVKYIEQRKPTIIKKNSTMSSLRT